MSDRLLEQLRTSGHDERMCLALAREIASLSRDVFNRAKREHRVEHKERLISNTGSGADILEEMSMMFFNSLLGIDLEKARRGAAGIDLVSKDRRVLAQVKNQIRSSDPAECVMSIVNASKVYEWNFIKKEVAFLYVARGYSKTFFQTVDHYFPFVQAWEVSPDTEFVFTPVNKGAVDYLFDNVHHCLTCSNRFKALVAQLDSSNSASFH